MLDSNQWSSRWFKQPPNLPCLQHLPICPTGVPRKKCIVRASSEGRFASCVVHFLLVFQDSVRSVAIFLKSCFLDASCRMNIEVHDSVGCSFLLRLKVLNYSHSIDICWVLAWANPLKMEVWKMMWHYSPLQSFSKEFDLRGYPPIGVFTFFDRPASHRLPVASMHCMYQCMYMFTNKLGNAKKVSTANAWREIQSRYSTWLESHMQYLSTRWNIQNACWVSCFFNSSLDSTPGCHQILSPTFSSLFVTSEAARRIS